MPVAYVHTGRLHQPRHRRSQAHDHPFHELVLVLSGRLSAVLPHTVAEAGRGELLWYPRGTWHLETVVGTGPCDWTWINFSADDLPTLPPRIIDRRRAIAPLIDLLWLRRNESGPGVGSYRDHLCAAIATELAVLNQPGGETDPWREGLEAWMSEHLAEPITLERLARLSGHSRAHFARTWRARTGVTPMSSLRKLRLQRARDLILGSGLTLAAIAPQVGFANEQVLSRLLRRHHGHGARALRRLR